MPCEAATTTSAEASTASSLVSCVGEHVYAVEQARADRRRRAGGDEHRRLPVELGRQPPQRAQEEPQRGALLLVAERDPDRAFVGGRASGDAPGRSTAYSAGKIRCISSRVASNEALRASSRPKNSSTKRRATWVESTRSAGAWNVPTLSEREWRSATDDALGANGSWTWTNSIGAAVSASSIVREMSSGGAGIAPRRAPASGSSSPTPSTRTPPSGSNSSPLRMRRRDSRTNAGSCEGASTTTRCPDGGLLGGEGTDEGVDLVLVLPGIRRHLGDGERLRQGGKA